MDAILRLRPSRRTDVDLAFLIMRLGILLAIALAVFICFGGCKAMDSLFFHPLHVLHEQHEYNEQHKAERAAQNTNSLSK